MDFSLSEEQRLLQESVDRFIERDYAFAARRKLVESEEGFGRENWATFAELGWLAVTLPEAHGGLGGTPIETMFLMEAFGRGLVVEPYLATVILGGGLLAFGGGEAQQSELLPQLAEGKLMLAFAYAEPQSRFNLADVETTAKKQKGGYVLSGRKSVVLHAPSADKIIVSARTAGKARDTGGISLFLVDKGTKGLSLRPYPTVDGLRAAEVSLDKVSVGADAVLGEPDAALPVIERVADHAIAALCAEAVGAMRELVTRTQEYLKTREQFGQKLSSFQVLQHRMVDMFMAQELSKSSTYMAAMTVTDEDSAVRARGASSAKAQIGQAGKFVGQQAIHLHGGMGMTDELPIGHYFKRLTMIDVMFGNADFHLKRFADLGDGR